MKIGKRIRELRKSKNITLEELSRKSGVALATLSRMENNKMTGTIDSHNSICKALGISLARLYSDIEDESKTVDNLRGKERAEYFSSSGKTRYELLVTNTYDKKMMPVLLRLEAGAETPEEKNAQGVEKFIYILSGTVEVRTGKKKFNLKQGDTLYYDASLPHSFMNTGKTDLEAVCVVSPPEI